MIDSAEEHNDPGTLYRLYRVRVERRAGWRQPAPQRHLSGRQRAGRPGQLIEMRREDGLWEWMAEHEAKGIKALAIPHNSNASKDMMFPDVDAAGDPIDLEYAQTPAALRTADRDDADQGQLRSAPQILGGRRVRRLRECRFNPEISVAALSTSATSCARA